MKKWIASILMLAGFALLIFGYVDAYQVTLEELKQPGTMYCGFMPLGVLSDLFWMQKYLWHRIGSVVLVLCGVVLRWYMSRTAEDGADE